MIQLIHKNHGIALTSSWRLFIFYSSLMVVVLKPRVQDKVYTMIKRLKTSGTESEGGMNTSGMIIGGSEMTGERFVTLEVWRGNMS